LLRVLENFASTKVSPKQAFKPFTHR
jgi:hypothetical protein